MLNKLCKIYRSLFSVKPPAVSVTYVLSCKNCQAVEEMSAKRIEAIYAEMQALDAARLAQIEAQAMHIEAQDKALAKMALLQGKPNE